MNAPRRRKITYVLTIVVLFTALIFLSRGIQRQADASKLAQKSLGQVNPVSGAAQLVLLGFRGVAVTFLWSEAIELKKKERWFEIRPVLESITLLQPNFIEPWRFQAWNMAYNIAGSWESVKDKYYWIHQGIDFMKGAVANNKDKPDLEWYVGYIYQDRFGVSDEAVYLRDLFKKDDDEEFCVAKSGLRDNFEQSYDWFSTANGTVLRLRKRPRQMAMAPFMSYPATAKSSFADWLGKEGTFGERTKNAYRVAHQHWIDFGSLGEPDRNPDFPLLRLEYTSSEWKNLTQEQRYWIERYQNVVNYNYWKARTRAEATDEMQAAREAFYQATKARENGDYERAISEYRRAFPIWRKILEGNSYLRTDQIFEDDSKEYEMHYLKMLRHLERPLPEKRPFDGMYPEMAPYFDPLAARASGVGLPASKAPAASKPSEQ